MDNSFILPSPEGNGRTYATNFVANINTPKDKRPLFREMGPAPQFPADALGPLKNAALAIRSKTQAPFSIAANSTLAVATLATQAHRDTDTLNGRKPLSQNFVTVAATGERKSSADRFALSEVHRIERTWKIDYERDWQHHANELSAWETARKKAEKASDRADHVRRLTELGPKPTPPQNPTMLVSDPTPEGLMLHLVSRASCGLFTDEGGLLIGGAAFNDETRMRTAALINKLWDGDPIKRIRRDASYSAILFGRRCSSHIMAQPVVADRLYGDAMVEGIGLTARMLLVAPTSTAGSRFYREPHPNDDVALAGFGAQVSRLLLKPPIMAGDGLDPPLLSLSPEAKLLLIGFHDECERHLGPNRYLFPIQGFGAKLAEHSVRLAAVLTVFDNPDAVAVPAQAMECGVTLAKHYADELLRLRGYASVSAELRKAQRLLDWLKQRGEREFHLAQIYQGAFGEVRDAVSAMKLVKVLEEHGQIDVLPVKSIVDGRQRKDAWRLRD